MAKLTVEIVTPEKRLTSVKADEAIIPGHAGLFGVRPGHTAFLSLVEPGTLTIREGNQSERYFVAGGFVEVSDDQVRVLADSAETLSSIDVAAAQKRLDEAQERLRGLPIDDARYAVETANVRRERARIASASGR